MSEIRSLTLTTVPQKLNNIQLIHERMFKDLRDNTYWLVSWRLADKGIDFMYGAPPN